MEHYKEHYVQPLVTAEDVYTVKVFTPKRANELKYTLTVTGSDGDLKHIETYDNWNVCKQRIAQLEFELQLDEWVD